MNELAGQSISYDPLQLSCKLDLVDDLVESLLNFALKMHRMGRLEDAFAAYNEVLQLDPTHSDALQLMGVILVQVKQPEKSLPYFNQSIDSCSRNHIAFGNRARAFEDLGKYNLAKADLLTAISYDQDNIVYYNNLFNILKHLNEYDLALEVINYIIEQTNQDFKLLNNKGVILNELGRFDEAIEVFKYILKNDHKRDNQSDYLHNYGNSLLGQKKFKNAIEKYDEAIKISPNYYRSYINRAHAYKYLSYYPRALYDYQKAVSLNPYDSSTEWNESLCLLTLKNFELGFLKYEKRLETPELRSLIFDCPLPPTLLISHHLQRGDYCGKRVFLASEQGIGDEIMFLSILPDLLEDAAHVTAQCDARSLMLLKRSFPNVEFIDKFNVEEIAVDKIDVAIRTGSLGYSYRRDMTSAPGTAYLKTDPSKVEAWKRELTTDRPLIGLSWRGGTDRTNREGRTATLDELRPLLEMEKYRFVSLQHGDVSEEIERFNRTTSNPIQFFSADRLRDLDELTALIDALDIVVSVQNTNVHLSGALGKICFAMMPKVPEWRYGLEGTRMDWYKSVELMRPKDYGNFGGMARALKSKIGGSLNRRSHGG